MRLWRRAKALDMRCFGCVVRDILFAAANVDVGRGVPQRADPIVQSPVLHYCRRTGARGDLSHLKK